MKVIIIGIDGFVGTSLEKYINKNFSNLSVYSIGKGFFKNNRMECLSDIADIISFIKRLTHKDDEPFICINCLSASNVDFCEKNPKVSCFVNEEFPRELFKRISDFSNARIFSFSSNAVYCGDNSLYSESSEFSPVNYYGQHKANLDEFIRLSDLPINIIRPTTLFGTPMLGNRSNPVYDLVLKAQSKDRVSLVSDLVVNIGYVDDLCEAICILINDQEIGGEYNFGGPERLSRYDLGVLIYRYYEVDLKFIKKVKMKDFSNFVMRPLDTSFDCKKFDTRFSISRTSVHTFLKYKL
jgi:dTDP-4-dehydrorhamnose reductase